MLRINQIMVDSPWMLECFMDGIFGDLIEYNSTRLVIFNLSCFKKVPCDCFALTVGIGGEKDFLGFRYSLLQLLDHLPLFIGNPIFGFKVVFDVNRKL